MSDADKRKFPRIDHVTSRQIIRLDDGQNPQKNIILTENVSGCGLKFTTNEELKPGSLFLIYLNDLLLQDIDKNKNEMIRSGDYYLCQVVWRNSIKSNFYEVGSCFFEKELALSKEMDTFTELVNISMLDSLPLTTPSLK